MYSIVRSIQKKPKMQLRRYTALLFGTALLALTGCLKDTEEFIPYEQFIESDALGVILNDKDLPVENATVVLEGEMTKTDSNGIFILDDVVISFSGSKLSIHKDGFFSTAVPINPNADNRSVNVRLTARGQDYSFLSTLPQDLVTGAGVRTTIPSNIFEDETGQDYNGLITANFGWIEPVDKDVLSRIPGGSIGTDANDQSVLLEHYGTVLTSFTTSTGQDLHLRDSESFVIFFPISPDLQSTAPDEIALWQFDEMKGQWIEKGVAIKEGSNYKATVTSTGYWSIQLPFHYATLSGQLKDLSGIGIERARISLSRDGANVKRRYWTDKNGRFSILYPIRENLNFDVEDECTDVLYAASIGPFLSKTELNTIELDPGDHYFRITGVVTKCSNPSRGVDKGYSLIRTDDYRWLTPLDQNGAFHSGLFVCSAQFIVSGRDLINEMGTNEPVIDDLGAKTRNLSVGALIACN
jgi:hypothetical protein